MARKKSEVVAQVGDMDEGEVRKLTIGDTDVLFSRFSGEYYAVGAHCTHYNAPLIDGHIEGNRIVCPWHHAEFDLMDGSNLQPPARDCLATFDVTIDGDDVVVTVPRNAEEHRPPEMVERTLGEDPRRFFILGSGAAGNAAAEELRRKGYKGRVYMVSPEEEVPYDRPNLSKAYLRGDIDDEAIALRDDNFYRRNGVDLMLGRTVERIDAHAQRLQFADGGMREYDRVLIATGSRARTLDVDGADLDGIFTLRSHDDARRIVGSLEEIEEVVVVGASFIGMEVAASLATRGLHVTVVAPEDTPFEKTLGEEVGEFIKTMHEEHGVEFELGNGVEGFVGDDHVEFVELSSGDQIPADVVVVGIGVEPVIPEIHGLNTRDDGSIEVDGMMRAGLDIFAAGDVACFPDPRTEELTRIEHWRSAEQLGRVAATVMADNEMAAPYHGVPFFWTRQYDVSIKYVGHAPEWDDIEIDGKIEEQDFIAYYVKDDIVLAAAGTRGKKLTYLQVFLEQNLEASLDDVRKAVKGV